MNAVDKGDFRGAIEKMAAHQMSFEVNGLWGLQDQGPIGEVYKQCRKSLPYVETIVTERLKAQTAVETSLL